MPSFKEISSFKEILHLVDKDTLFVLDIDETVLEYTGVSTDHYWAIFNSHFEKLKNFELAEEIAQKEWKELVKNAKPRHTDEEGIDALFKKTDETGAPVIFETARSSKYRQDTLLQFEHLGLPKTYKIFYDHEEKGPGLRDILKVHPLLVKNRIVFVDDLEENLISMSKTFGSVVKCFKFKKTV